MYVYIQKQMDVLHCPTQSNLNAGVDESGKGLKLNYILVFKYFGLTACQRHTNIELLGNLYSPAVTVQVIFKVDFTTLIHYCRF